MENNMYIKQLRDKNVGPLTDVRIDFPFFDNGNPKPIVLVGENGTGKSTIISNIVDALFEIAGEVYTNARIQNSQNGYQYYKAISPAEIHNGSPFMYSYILFDGESSPKYVFKSGNISGNDFKAQIGDETINLSWEDRENYKQIFVDKKAISDIWKKNVICYFGPDRYEKPAWMGNKYYQIAEDLHPTIKNNLNGILKNPIIVRDVTSPNLQWLLDIIADSRADIIVEGETLSIDSAKVPNLLALRQARNNLEVILSRIMGDEVYFQLNYRNSGGSRFRIVRKSDNRVICPTLDSLSTGQIALFNLFATIVRYADNNNINQSIHLDNITGIVVVDEIELHLHSKLQKEVLPQLIHLFPKIQFVITSHAPLFLLGMKDTFGEDGFNVYEMPKAEKITVERFSEFLRAYNYIKETKQYHEEIKDIANSIPSGDNPLVITEGSTDWKHMKTAYNVLCAKEEYKELFEGLCIEFLEYEPKNSSSPNPLKIEMGNTALIPLCESSAKLPHDRKYIIIADRDTPTINQKLIDSGKQYKKWGINTYSILLPIPQNRADTPDICIEHYYSDAEIEKEIEVNGVKRHLFMGKDFSANGFNSTLDRFCERKDVCGPGKICIIDGTQGERVRKLSDENDTTNFAIPKSDFAIYVSSHTDEFDFSNFIPLFELIKSIIEEGESDV